MESPRRAVAYFAERVGYEEFAAGANRCSQASLLVIRCYRACVLANLR